MTKYKIKINEEELIKDYKVLKSCKKVAEKYKCSKSTITKRLHDFGVDLSINIRNSPKKFLISDEEIKKLYLEGKSLVDIAKVAQTTKGFMCLRAKLQSLGVDTTKNMKKYSIKIHKSCKKYLLDEHVFDTIDTEEKAYWLGFLMADGYNHESKSCVALRLNAIDREILEKFKIFLKTDTPIQTYQRETPVGKVLTDYCELNICSPIFSQSLAKQGCIQRKTYLLEFPNILPALYNHFIRGYFDGDGCISIRERKDRKNHKCKAIMFNISGRESVVLRIQEILCEKVGVTKTKPSYKKNSFLTIIHWGGHNVCKRILDYLYKDATIFLQRKYKKYKEL